MPTGPRCRIRPALLLPALLAALACGPPPAGDPDPGSGISADAAVADDAARPDADSADRLAADAADPADAGTAAPCEGDPPTCFPTPYGGCCMGDAVPARCEAEAWRCPDDAADYDECVELRDFCPMDVVDAG